MNARCGPHLNDVILLQLVQFCLDASQTLAAVEHQKVLRSAEAEDWVAIAVVVDRGIGRVVSIARRQSLQNDIHFYYGRTGVGEVGIRKIVECVFGEYIGLALVGEIDIAQLAQRRQAKISRIEGITSEQ